MAGMLLKRQTSTRTAGCLKLLVYEALRTYDRHALKEADVNPHCGSTTATTV
jgi:hypothetical protein